MNQPLIKAGEFGTGFRYKKDFEDTFPGTALNADNWYPEMMEARAHRVGSKGINDLGELEEGATPSGKRHSAWYGKHHDITLKVDNGLHMGVHVVNEHDPTRPQSYTYAEPDGTVIHPGNQKIYVGWAGSARSIWHEPEKRRIIDTSCAHRTFRYGFFETEIDINNLWAEGIRLSSWGLGMHTEDGEIVEHLMYNDDPSILELDFFEVEVSERFMGKHNNCLQMKNLAGKCGNSPGGNVDCSKFTVNLLDGKPHIIGHLWLDDGHHWYVDGYETNRDLDRVMQVYAQWALSREACCGIVSDTDGALPTSIAAKPPYLPRDPGLYLTDCFRDLESARDSVGIVKRTTHWEIKPVGLKKREPKLVTLAELNPTGQVFTREEAPPVATERTFTRNDNLLTWNAYDFERKWNVYIDGEYITTVHEPSYQASGSVSGISVEGLSERSSALMGG